MVTKTTKNRKIPATRRKSTGGTKRKIKTNAGVGAKIVEDNKEFLKGNIENNKTIVKIYIIIGIILIIILSSFFIYKYFIKPNNYLIQNKYYEFSLKTPNGWIAEEKTLYTEDYVSKILTECKNDKLNKESIYEIGAFRFKSQKYANYVNFSNFSTAGFSSGIIMGITVNCIPEGANGSAINYSNREGKNTVFIKNNLKYIITQDIYISPADKNKSAKLKIEYKNVINNIISSLKIIK